MNATLSIGFCAALMSGQIVTGPDAFASCSVAILQKGEYFLYTTFSDRESYVLRIYSTAKKTVIRSIPVPSPFFTLSPDEKWLFAFSAEKEGWFDAISLSDGKRQGRLVNGYEKNALADVVPSMSVSSNGEFLYAQQVGTPKAQRWRMQDIYSRLENSKGTAEIKGTPWSVMHFVDLVHERCDEIYVVGRDNKRYRAKLDQKGTRFQVLGEAVNGLYSPTMEYVSFRGKDSKFEDVGSAAFPGKAIFRVPVSELYPNFRHYFHHPFSDDRSVLIVVPAQAGAPIRVAFFEVVRRSASDIRCKRTEYEVDADDMYLEFMTSGWASLKIGESRRVFFQINECEDVIRRVSSRVRRFEHPLPAVDS